MRVSPAIERLATWGALFAVGVFLIWSLVEIDGLLAVINQNSDNASAPVIAHFLPDRGSGQVTLGTYPWLEPLYLLDLTRWLPSQRVAWEIEPFLIYALTIALVGWTVARTVSRHAGLLVGLAMAAPAPWVIWMLGAPNQRLLTLSHAVILAAFIVSAPAASGWTRPKQLLWAGALAVTLAPGVASDPLVLLGGVVPFLGALALGWRLKLIERNVTLIAAAACLIGAGAGRALLSFAEHHGVIYYHYPYPLATASQAVSNLRLLLEDVALFAHGRLGGAPGPFSVTVEQIGLVAMVGVPVFCVLVGRRARAMLGDQGRPPAQRLLAVYWAIAAAAIAVAFIASTAPTDISAVRYMTIVWPALLTIAAIVWRRQAIVWLAGLATGAAVLGSWDIAHGGYANSDPNVPTGADVQGLKRFVANNHLDHGYAQYWNAAAITDETDFEARIYPITPCAPSTSGSAPNTDQLCQFSFHTIDSWYEPKPGARTFLLLNDNPLAAAALVQRPAIGVPYLIPHPPASWGPPVQQARFGHLTAYVYDYDLATRLGPPPP
jgi:hypothetical protein